MVAGEGGNDDENLDRSRRCIVFSECIRTSHAAQDRQQATHSGKAERADGLQTRRRGQGHQAVDRRLRSVGAQGRDTHNGNAILA